MIVIYYNIDFGRFSMFVCLFACMSVCPTREIFTPMETLPEDVT